MAAADVWWAMNGAVEPDVQEAVERKNRFIATHLRRIFLLVYRIVGHVDDAQDLTQEVFIKALQREEQLRDPEKSAHWLSRIATNTAIDFLRRHGRIQFAELEAVAERPAGSTSETPEQILLRRERRAWLEEGLQVLTERERLALVLRDVEDLPPGEVARRLGCSKATVRSHIANARVKLRRYMEGRQP
ncbi:MAG: RNA polymerase sigma factor [Bryobacterales bacterium]|nr:RNA polymerase sigma factor [Bryobacteraceae bacterium]MDW8353581.1 RNA polymerase sigma factor [Bryobacterales bacterium]